VTDLVIHVQGSNLILNWSASGNADSYNIYRASEPFGTFNLLQSTSDTTCTDVGAAAASKYFYQVRASN
jgi:fibronectin type 3 domain-containing protein